MNAYDREQAAGASADPLDVVELTKRLLRARSETPPGDTNAPAAVIAAAVAGVEGIETENHPGAPHVANLVLRVRGPRPGKRLVFNGHLDTYPLGEGWTTDPDGEQRDGKLYGLGVSDMKGGVAAITVALARLAAKRQRLAGEVVATFVGDEETMGELGAKLLLETVPHARGDAMISADVGSPGVLRFGEKGMIWLTLKAQGKAAHAAHVHRGDSAIEKLVDVIQALKSLRDWPVTAPGAVTRAIAGSAPVSEALSGAGESHTLGHVTVTFGTIRGGRLSNLIADEAEATADIRLPAGVTVAELEERIGQIVAATPGVSVDVVRRYEPNWTAPDHPVMEAVSAACEAVLGERPVRTMRVGASDARHYRYAGIPTVTCGLTPTNMGAADEHVSLDELRALADVLTRSAELFLAA
ncbi:M20/M25/M40 family metallo-hydrolase [Hansschlegelia beijingensis]|uniref:Succinyl-diaminopimelate desuccinylase n=1 Tax=Hansschlegelia beijingensis TaxID=1133344 RepID=A0A7W6D6X3_9HYPH|nr:M20/M25/M40 family metallo-hydrolase [Hansschlegelia beijingensis]MBB3973334.1 succinyl-diaminopimelate desuccinylase [Hansschlegelia beijingensis]